MYIKALRCEIMNSHRFKDYWPQPPPTIFWDKDFPANYNPDSYREQTFTSYLSHRFTAFYFIN
ncbi:MAG: hypothetical protein IT252_08360 [Chitinophagaceae bacterium]|nr:hypothetical protein [Chitinophagaceae bacterium]